MAHAGPGVLGLCFDPNLTCTGCLASPKSGQEALSCFCPCDWISSLRGWLFLLSNVVSRYLLLCSLVGSAPLFWTTILEIKTKLPFCSLVPSIFPDMSVARICLECWFSLTWYKEGQAEGSEGPESAIEALTPPKKQEANGLRAHIIVVPSHVPAFREPLLRGTSL